MKGPHRHLQSEIASTESRRCACLQRPHVTCAVGTFDEMTNFELTLHNLERLSLLEKVVQYVSGDVSIYEIGGELVSIPSERSGMRTSYALTQYGVNFIWAVRPEHP